MECCRPRAHQRHASKVVSAHSTQEWRNDGSPNKQSTVRMETEEQASSLLQSPSFFSDRCDLGRYLADGRERKKPASE